MRVAFVAVAALFWCTGCDGDTVCIQWSEQEGACPAREDVLDYVQPSCDAPIESVDSDGEFDGQSCCYEITKGESDTCED